MSSPSKPDPDQQDPERKENFWVQTARYSELAMIFPAAIVVGWLAGAGLDRWLHTSWLYIAGLILGGLAGFVDLIRLVLRDSQ